MPFSESKLKNLSAEAERLKIASSSAELQLLINSALATGDIEEVHKTIENATPKVILCQVQGSNPLEMVVQELRANKDPLKSPLIEDLIVRMGVKIESRDLNLHCRYHKEVKDAVHKAAVAKAASEVATKAVEQGASQDVTVSTITAFPTLSTGMSKTDDGIRH